MPAFLEAKLKKQYGAKSRVPYKIMNAKGYMRGNKETKKGAAAQVKHERDHPGAMHNKAYRERIAALKRL